MTDKVPQGTAMTRSGRLLAKLKLLDAQNAELEGELEQTRGELEAHQMAGLDDQHLEHQLQVLQEFVDDWRLGIRDFDEWPDVLAREGMEPFVPVDRV